MDLEDIARSVLEQYEIHPTGIRIIQQGGIKTVWKVETDRGPLCLKRLKQTKEKALFSVEAQRYIKAKGGNVPGVLENKAGNPIVDYNDQLFVLYEWIDGKQLNFDNMEDFSMAMEGLARFHRFSKGYQPPEGARVSTKLGKWPNQYRSMLSKLSEWRTVAELKAGVPVYDKYLEWAEPMITLGEEAIRYLEASHYAELSSPGSPAVVLCHQDYGKGNALSTPDGVWVLDLDGVTFELVARDLRKIILKTMENRGGWDKHTMNEIIAWYESENPLTPDERKVVYIDTLFPHSFFGTVKNQFSKNKPVKAADIERTGRIEVSKRQLLREFLKKE